MPMAVSAAGGDAVRLRQTRRATLSLDGRRTASGTALFRPRRDATDMIISAFGAKPRRSRLKVRRYAVIGHRTVRASITLHARVDARGRGTEGQDAAQ